MLRSLWLLFLFVSFLGLGTSAPFVLALGYVWVDTFRPQDVAYIVLNQIPVAMIMGAGAFGAYFAMDRRDPPRPNAMSTLHVLMAVWVTVTMTWGVAGSFGWEKWDWAFKSLVFSAFVPLVIRSRIQIEAFAQTYVFSLAANFVPFGVKTLISGGGYGTNLGLAQGNSGLSEGGLLSTVCLMAVPLALFLAKHSLLMPKIRFMPLAYWGVAGLATVCAVGTYQRSALVGLVVMAFFMFLRSKNKFIYGIIIAIGAAAIIYLMSGAWSARISTIQDYQNENSAYTRILVWKWTLEYTLTHPLGGGFNSYVINSVTLPPNAAHPGGYTEFGRAFHSIYFEVLGEQGWPGLIMFLTIALGTMASMRRISKKTRKDPDLAWAGDLADALLVGISVLLSAGAFVGIAFQPMFWYFVAMGISLNAYIWRVENQAAKPTVGWRAQGSGHPGAVPIGGRIGTAGAALPGRNR